MGNVEKMKKLNRGLLVGRFKQNAGAGQPFFYDVDIMVSTVLPKQNKDQKVRPGRTPSVLVRATCNVHLVKKRNRNTPQHVPLRTAIPW